eukprot:3432774-Prymnesium_polylepis.1
MGEHRVNIFEHSRQLFCSPVHGVQPPVRSAPFRAARSNMSVGSCSWPPSATRRRARGPGTPQVCYKAWTRVD